MRWQLSSNLEDRMSLKSSMAIWPSEVKLFFTIYYFGNKQNAFSQCILHSRRVPIYFTSVWRVSLFAYYLCQSPMSRKTLDLLRSQADCRLQAGARMFPAFACGKRASLHQVSKQGLTQCVVANYNISFFVTNQFCKKGVLKAISCFSSGNNAYLVSCKPFNFCNGVKKVPSVCNWRFDISGASWNATPLLRSIWPRFKWCGAPTTQWGIECPLPSTSWPREGAKAQATSVSREPTKK